MSPPLLSLCALLLFGACSSTRPPTAPDRAAIAERFLRGLYGGDPSVVDELAGPDIVVSYPMFEEAFGKPTIRGREAVRAFCQRFSTRWTDAEVTVHEAVAGGDRVVLLWSFRARRVGEPGAGDGGEGRIHGWGGITLYRFDATGRIVAEIGEESDPGPAGRLGTP